MPPTSAWRQASTVFLYVWGPSGNRVELANAGARLLLAPDWQTISWTAAERAKGRAWASMSDVHAG